MSLRLRAYILVLLSVCVTIAVVWHAVDRQRDVALRGAQLSRSVDAMRTAMIDQETGVRGYVLTGRPAFFEPFRTGRREWRAAARRIVRLIPTDDRALHEAYTTQLAAGARWQVVGDAALARHARGERAPTSTAEFERRKRLMDAFRATNRDLQDVARRRLEHQLTRVRAEAALSVSAVAIVALLLALALVERQSRRERRRRAAADAFTFALQHAEREDTAHAVIARHLEQAVRGASVRVLAGEVRDTGGAFAVPCVVRGEVVATVIAARDRPLTAGEVRAVEQAVAQAGPALANLRLLAAAEHAAATDVLTGLPNGRAARDRLTRLAADARRTGMPLTAVVLDIDHFKQVNDTYGHPAGDAALAAIGRTLAATLGRTDFVARWGGEEFLVLLPGTGAAGGRAAAERVRAAIASLALDAVPGGVTASLGVATLPDHARDEEELVHRADEALYAAKAAGRDRVCTSGSGDCTPAAPRLAVAAAPEPEDLLDRLVRTAAELTDAPAACLAVADGHGGRVAAEHGAPGRAFAAHAATAGPLVAPDAAAHHALREDPAVAAEGIRACASFPVRDARGRRLGALCVMDGRTRDWDRRQLHALEHLADTIAVALPAVPLAGDRLAGPRAARLRPERRARTRRAG